MIEPEQTKSRVFEQRATIDSWDRDYHHPIAEAFYDRAVLKMLQLMKAQPGATVLDAGCAPGVHTVRVARAGLRVCAVDISQTMLEEAQSRISAAGLFSAVELRHEDLTALTFRNASFKYVFSCGVIIHIREIEKALDELTRIIEPGGKLALYVTNRNSWDQKLELLARVLLRKRLIDQQSFHLGTGTWYEMHGQKLWVWQFDIVELERQLEIRGLQLIHRQIGEFSESSAVSEVALSECCYDLTIFVTASISLPVSQWAIFLFSKKISEFLPLQDR